MDLNGQDIGISHIVSGIVVASVLGLWRMITGKASKEELARAIDTFDKTTALLIERVDEHYVDSRESREKLYEKVDEINRSLGATMVSLSRLQGQLDRNEEGRRR